MTQEQITLLRAIPIEDIASRLGLDVRHHKALCPFHNDHHASLSFNVRKNTYRCFVCDAHGDTIDLVHHILHKDFKEACQWLSGSDQWSVASGQMLAQPSEERVFDASKYERFFSRPYLSPAAKAFLFDQRRLDPRVIRWCRLTSWRDRQGTHWLQIPYYDRDGKLVGLQNRNLDYHPNAEGQFSTVNSQLSIPNDSHFSTPNDSQFSIVNSQLSIPSQPRFKFPKGAQCGIYNLPVLNRLKEGEALYIAEGASDCWALLSAGHKAIAIPSATLLKKDDLQPLLTLNSELLTQFHMYPDRDLPGERLFLQLQSLLPNLTHHHLPPDCKDYSDLYLQLHLNGRLDGVL
jgi:hypothetical protein